MARFIICRASAGSGKTYALVRQYIEIAISSPAQLERRFGHILAITFTNKAANGMKQRIIEQLGMIVERDPDSDNLVEEISGHLGISVDETVRRCSVVYSSIMHHYSDFSVCTIDSFVHRLVRSFAHDLNLPLNFNLLIDYSEILQFSVDELLSLAGSENADSLTKVLCAFTENLMEDGHGYRIEGRIADLAEKIFNEDAPLYMDKLKEMDFNSFLDLHSSWMKENRQFEQQLSAIGKEALEVCHRHGLSRDDFLYKSSGVYAWFERLAGGDCSGLGKGSRIDKAFGDGVLYAKDAPPQLRQAIETATPELSHCYDKVGLIAKKGMVLYNTRQLILPRLYTLAMLNKIRKIKDEYYKDTETVHISEFNKRIEKEIADQPAPYIYERIGSRYYNYLIDEFQDTSRLQWHNFLPLLDEAMSHQFSDDTSEVGMQSLVVGDGKQAIYRFRQGDVRQFLRLPKVDSPMHGASLQYNARIDDQYINHRSLGNIVNFNNRFFEWVINTHFSHNDKLVQLYLGDGTEKRPCLYQDAPNEGGYVDVEFHDEDKLFDAVGDIIRHQVDDLGYKYGDIMVIARDNKTLVRISDRLIAASADNPIPLVSSESFVLSNSMAVMLLFSMLKHLSDASDNVAALQVLQYAAALHCLPNDEPSDLLWQLHETGFNLDAVLCSHGIMVNSQYLLSLSLYDCCEELLRLFHLHGIESSYVATFLDSVLSFTSRHRSDIKEFVKFFEEKIDSVSSTTVGDMNAVKLMTIHKAKGLEEKVVIYVIPKPRTHSGQMWVNIPAGNDIGIPVAYVNTKKEIDTLFADEFHEEELMSEMDRVNLLYVALTRPEDKLIVLCENKPKAKSDDYISLLHQFVSADKQIVADGNRFTIGDDSHPIVRKTKKKKKKITNYPIDSVVFPQWEDRIGIAAQSEAILSALDQDSRRYGIMVHDLLSHVVIADDVERVVDNYCREYRLGETAKAAVLSRVTAMVEKEENRMFFAPGNRVLCETSIVVGGEVRRPDRIVFADGHTWVVDFKTGAYNDTSHEKYQKQVNQYVAAVAAMGYPNVRGAIVYL